jgi:RNA recognition motif-containing protein
VTKPLEIDSNRLYITNIPYVLSEDDIRSSFSRFGAITKIKLPKEYDGKNKGFFFITY